ncbi:synaptotagmin-like protein 1 isoform X4 [Hippocampus zosterae]|nr:synaptotagmin-like protein 1 isoform X4 [Hippocampus zosterae]
MEANVGANSSLGSLDLSHLTEEEQETILQVLLRDLDLRRQDEGRVRSEDAGAERNRRGATPLAVGGVVPRGIQQATPRPYVRLGPGARHHTPSTDKGQRSPPSFDSSPIRERTATKEDRQRYKRESVSMCNIQTDAGRSPLQKNNFHSSHMLSGGTMSLFSSGVFGVVEVRGRLQFSLAYDGHKGELRVKVHRCEDIAAAADEHRSDPYVKCYLLPDMSSRSKRKTVVKRRTQNPVFEQTLKYKVRQNELNSRTLNLSVWHSEPLARNVFLGEVEVALGLWDWTCTQPLWQELQPRFNLKPDCVGSRGTLLFSIKFIPEGFEGGMPLTGELHIWLQEAQGLLSKKGGAVDSFVKSYILPDVGCQSGQKTQVVKRSISPSYNHTMVYDGFQSSDLEEACAELSVWQREGFKQHMIGGIRLSCGTGQSYGETVRWMDSTEEEVSVWTSMIKNQNRWIEATLPIRTNLAHRSSD